MLCFGSGCLVEGLAERGMQPRPAHCQARDPWCSGQRFSSPSHAGAPREAAGASVLGTEWGGAGQGWARGVSGPLSGDWECLTGPGGKECSLVQYLGAPSWGRWALGQAGGRGLLGLQSMLRGLGGGGGQGVHSVHETSLMKLSFPSAQKYASHTEGQVAAPWVFWASPAGRAPPPSVVRALRPAPACGQKPRVVLLVAPPHQGPLGAKPTYTGSLVKTEEGLESTFPEYTPPRRGTGMGDK